MSVLILTMPILSVDTLQALIRISIYGKEFEEHNATRAVERMVTLNDRMK